jgi:hypothetical protein
MSGVRRERTGRIHVFAALPHAAAPAVLPQGQRGQECDLSDSHAIAGEHVDVATTSPRSAERNERSVGNRHAAFAERGMSGGVQMVHGGGKRRGNRCPSWSWLDVDMVPAALVERTRREWRPCGLKAHPPRFRSFRYGPDHRPAFLDPLGLHLATGDGLGGWRRCAGRGGGRTGRAGAARRRRRRPHGG